jgi:hypothetical protein
MQKQFDDFERIEFGPEDELAGDLEKVLVGLSPEDRVDRLLGMFPPDDPITTLFKSAAKAIEDKRYDPNQPRVPAGHGRTSGRWTDGDDGEPLTAEQQAIADSIPRSDRHLTPEEREVEEKFIRTIAINGVDAMLAEYDQLEGATGGKTVNTDTARELSDDYSASPENRALFAAAVHEPASWLMKEKLERLVAHDDGRNVMSVLAGGGGSGKSSATAIPEAKALLDISKGVFDGCCAEESKTIRRIEDMVARGNRVNYIFVARDPYDAIVNGIVTRAIKGGNGEGVGRTVPIEEAARQHAAAAKVAVAVMARFAGSPSVRTFIIDNTRGPGKAARGSVDVINRLKHEGSHERAQAEIDRLYAAGRVSAPVYRGLVGHKTAGGKGRDRSDDRSDDRRAEFSSDEAGRGSDHSLIEMESLFAQMVEWLKKFDPSKHPRHPGGAPNSQGGRFRRVDESVATGGGDKPSASMEWAEKNRQQALSAVVRMRNEAHEIWTEIQSLEPAALSSYKDARDFMLSVLTTIFSNNREVAIEEMELEYFHGIPELGAFYHQVKDYLRSKQIDATLQLQAAKEIAIAAAKLHAADVIEQELGNNWSPKELDQLRDAGFIARDLVRHEEIANRESTLKLHISKDEWEEQEKRLRFTAAGLDVYMHRDSIISILSGGRVKTQFESGNSGGTYNPKLRNSVESVLFNQPSTDPVLRPTYGVLYSEKNITEKQFDAAMYGRYLMKLNVRDRATFTPEDSLSMNNGKANFLPSSVIHASISSLFEVAEIKLIGNPSSHIRSKINKAVNNGLRTGSYSYAEAQIHGGVSVRDVEKIYDIDKYALPNARAMAYSRLNGIDYLYGDKSWMRLN